MGDWTGLLALGVFLTAYAAVVGEERLRVRKSVPMLLAAGGVWILVGIAYAQAGEVAAVADAVRDSVLTFAELFLFLIPAMTYVNTLEERGVFGALRGWLVQRRLSLRAVYWLTGVLAFCLSPLADNLTTALVLGGVAVAVGRESPRFVRLACTNIVVAANAGGAFSPFGDITTLMVWQAGMLPFSGFFRLAVPALVSWLVPAALLGLAVGPGRPCAAADERPAALAPGAAVVLLLFVLTLALSVLLHNLFGLPPALGMMLGLGLLKAYGSAHQRRAAATTEENGLDGSLVAEAPPPAAAPPLDVFRMLERVEWDTLLFFYGVLLAVGGLGALGYLGWLAGLLYAAPDPTMAHVLLGVASAVVDNVPVMYAVLGMAPHLSEGQWLLVTLTTGIGGSLLSVGSAAGVALMGQARGLYTFGAHLRWAWAVALGYAAGIATHLVLNQALF